MPPSIRDDFQLPSHTTYSLNGQPARAMQQEPPYERNVVGITSAASQMRDMFGSTKQFQSSKSVSNDRATKTGMTIHADRSIALGTASHPSLSSRRNLSHLMLSPRYRSVQHQSQVHDVAQKNEQPAQVSQAQVNQREIIIRTALAIQQEDQLRAVIIAREVALVEQQRRKEMDRLRQEIQIMEQVQNDRQSLYSSAMAIPPFTLTQVDAIANMLPDVRRALLRLNQSVDTPFDSELGIPNSNQHRDDNLFLSSFPPQLQYPTVFDVASTIMIGTPSRSVSSISPSIGATNAYEVANVATVAGNTLYPSLIPLVLPVLLGQVDTYGGNLSESQLLLRQQIEIFEAGTRDVVTHVRGRNKSISLGQVGMRCKHCAHTAIKDRQKGSIYFPSTKSGVYQAALNMSSTHITKGVCQFMPVSVTSQFAVMSTKKQNSIGYQKTGSGRQYWIHSASQLGLIDTEDKGIRFIRSWTRDVETGNVMVDGL